MKSDRIDDLLADWAEERPDLCLDAMGIVLRIQTLAKRLAGEVTGELKELDLEWWEYDALAVLRRQGEPYRMAATELAESTMLSPGALTNRIDRLQARRLVKRIEDPGDRRRVLVQLDRKGRALIDRATEARFASAGTALEGLTGNQRRQLDQLLRRMMLRPRT